MPKKAKVVRKKRIKVARKRRPKSCMMVIRARVPLGDDIRVHQVLGLSANGTLYNLEVLNAYLDYEGQPNAMPD